jgi:hypothetical protein
MTYQLSAIGSAGALGVRSLKSQQTHSLYKPAALKIFLSKYLPTNLIAESNSSQGLVLKTTNYYFIGLMNQ